MNPDERARLAEFAEGFMHKETGRDALLSAIVETAAKPALPTSKDMASNDDQGFLNSGLLTKRERAILREIARGNSIDQIAESLSISPSTVRKHRENMMKKLNTNSNAQLVRAAMQVGQY